MPLAWKTPDGSRRAASVETPDGLRRTANVEVSDGSRRAANVAWWGRTRDSGFDF